MPQSTKIYDLVTPCYNYGCCSRNFIITVFALVLICIDSIVVTHVLLTWILLYLRVYFKPCDNMHVLLFERNDVVWWFTWWLLLLLFIFKSIVANKITNTSASTLARMYFSDILGRYHNIAKHNIIPKIVVLITFGVSASVAIYIRYSLPTKQPRFFCDNRYIC